MNASSLSLLAALALSGTSAQAVDIVAHRGASYDAPENTLASTRLAWEQKADAVETDIFLSKDGQLAVLHDKNTKRTAGLDAEVVNQTMAELRKLDAGTWKGAQFAGETIPLLEEQLALTPAGKRVFVEIKIGPEIVPELKRVLTKLRASEKNITVISFKFETLEEVRKQLPHLPTQWLVGYRHKADAPNAGPPPRIEDVIRPAKAAGFTGLDLQATWPLTLADIKKIRAAGLELHVWTVDDPAVAQHWIDLGAKSITTNRPAFMRQALQL